MPMTEQLIERSTCCGGCGHDDSKIWLEAPDRFYAESELFRLRRCAHCGLVWLDNPPAPEEMGRHYGPDYDRLISNCGETSPERWRARREEISRHKISGALLDLGCSSGAFLESMKGPAWQLYGIEMSVDAAKKAEARTGARVFVGDILDAPFAPESFDVVTCFDVLEHVYEPRAVLAKVREWLKPGGIFYVLVPNIDSAESRVFKSYWYGLELPRHISHFSCASLRTMATSAGLEEVRVEAHSNSAFERSASYVFNDLLRGIGISRPSMAQAAGPSLPWKVIRKMFRMTIFPLLYLSISLLGEGESIHGVFKKGAPR
jgi:2-polyprenyl-3-methyl-5-hydroxy-6-metoxy-1,4-benzoquinol methylase